MSEAVADPTPIVPIQPEPANQEPKIVATEPEALVEADLLVEDVSIDGMCGVY